jgi:hypothetical protein
MKPLSHNLKPAKLIGRLGPTHIFPFYKMFQAGITHRLAKTFQFGPLALGNEFDAAIRQITHGPDNLETVRDRARAIPEANALHAAGI